MHKLCVMCFMVLKSNGRLFRSDANVAMLRQNFVPNSRLNWMNKDQDIDTTFA